MPKRRAKRLVLLAGVAAIVTALLAWYVWDRATRLPVHTTGQALLLGCDDSVQPGEKCHPYRVGGKVIPRSMRRGVNRDTVEFTLTDGCTPWDVIYVGDRSHFDRLRAGDFAIAEGSTSVDGNFWSNRMFTGAEAESLRRDMHAGESASFEGCNSGGEATPNAPLGQAAR